jgi:hypothetical protein
MRLFNDDGLYIGPEDLEPEEAECPTCGVVLAWETCGVCGGDDDGLYLPGEEDDVEHCAQCGGFGGWYRCAERHGGKRCWQPDELPTP